MGLPFMSTKSQLGSDIIKYNPKIKVIDDPYTDLVHGYNALLQGKN